MKITISRHCEGALYRMVQGDRSNLMCFEIASSLTSFVPRNDEIKVYFA
jgi:hypothetical protein